MIFNIILQLIFPPTVSAHCPLCVAGAGAGLALSRFLGIDDTISGVWMAAFLGASSLWLSNSIKKKYIPLQAEFIYIAIFATTILSFYKFGLVNEHNGLISNLPKLVFGMIVGGVVFYLVDVANTLVRKKVGRTFFPYQGVIVSLASMLVLSVFFFVLLNYWI